MDVTPMEIPGNDSYSTSSDDFYCDSEATQYAMWIRVTIVVVSVLLCSVTVVCNLIVMISFKIDKQLRTNSNYFVLSLSVADFMIGLISMPLFTLYTVLGYWPLGPHACDLWLCFDYFVSNASALNLLAISFDRYFSVKYPLKYRAKMTSTKALIAIGFVWFISFILWPPWIYTWQYNEDERIVPETTCYIHFFETSPPLTTTTSMIAFYIPVVLMAFLYYKIWKETKKRQKDLSNLQADKQDASKRSNLKCDEALGMEDCRKQRSELNTGGDVSHATHIAGPSYEHTTCRRLTLPSAETSRPTNLENIPSDSARTILMKLPSNGDKYNEKPSIKMISDELHIMMKDDGGDGDGGIPLKRLNILKSMTAGKGILNKRPNKKKKKLHKKKADRKAAKTLSIILLVFIITWAPYNILVLVKSIAGCALKIARDLWTFSYYLCYLNSTVNPICYALGNATFYKTFVRILKCKWHSRNRGTAVVRG